MTDANPTPPPQAASAAAPTNTTVYRVQTTVNGKPMYQYFSGAAIQGVAAELFAATAAGPIGATLSSFEADVSAINLAEFFAAGGMLIGPVAIK